MNTDKLISEAIKRFNSLSPTDQSEMMRKQRESWVRGMTTPCEHGVLDFETCAECRAPTEREA